MKHKKTHRILSMLLAVSLAFSMTGGFAFASDEGANGAGSAIGTSSLGSENVTDSGTPPAPPQVLISDIVALINDLRDLDLTNKDAVLEKQDTIQALKDAYAALSTADRVAFNEGAKKTRYDELIEALAGFLRENRPGLTSDDVGAMLDALADVNLSDRVGLLAAKDKLTAALKAYEKLAEGEKRLLTEAQAAFVQKLSDALKGYYEKPATSAEIAELISRLATAADAGEAPDADAVRAARAVYDALTDEEKAAFDPDTLALLVMLEAALAAVPMAGEAITIEVSDGTTTKTGGGDTLAKAVTASGVYANSITALKITAGEVTAADWTALATPLPELKTFEIDAAVTVANIPDSSRSIFPTRITSVIIPQAITVGNSAFSECTTLANLNLPAATSIGEEAFYDCFKLTTVELPAATSIGTRAFENCRILTTATLPAATSIGDYAFYTCAQLSTVSLPAVTTIGRGAFSECKALVTLKLPATPPTGSDSSFANCPQTNPLVILDADGTTALADPTALATAIAAYKAAPDGNTADNLWWGWTLPAAPELPKITIQANGGAAVGGTSLSDAVTKALNGAAANTITALKITAGEVTAADWNYFAGGTPGTTRSPFTALTTFEVDAAVTKVENIPNGASSVPIFPISIQTVTMPQVIVVGSNAFFGCSQLAKVSLPKTATIDRYAFFNCKSLSSVSLPAATTVNEGAFGQCDLLATLELPKVTHIGGMAFMHCPQLATLKLPAAPPIITGGEFSGCLKTNPLVIVGADGITPLEGDALANAQKAYDDVTANGNVANDGKWYGWKVREPVADPVARWAITGGGTGEGTLTEALAAVKASGGTITLLANVEDTHNPLMVTISGFSNPVTLVLNGKTLHADVIFEEVRGLFTIDGTAEGSKIQGATSAAIFSDGTNLKLKGGSYIGASEGGETAPAIAMTVAAGDTKEKLKDLLADGYAYESEDGFTVADVDGQSTAITGNAVKVVTATTDPATQILFFKGDGKLYYRTLPDATHPDGTLTEVPAGAVPGWSADGNVLTLMEFNFTTSAQYGLMISGNATVKLRGRNNSITSTYTSSTASDKSAGIYCLESDSVKVYFEGTSTLTATGGNLTGNYSNSYGIWSANLFLQFSDCTVKAIGGTAANSYGVYARNFTLKNAAKVTGQTANATTEAYGVYVHTSVFNIGGGGELTGEAGTAAKSQAVRWSHGNPIKTGWRFWGGNAYDQPAKATNGNNNNDPYYIALESAPTAVLSKAKITCVEAKWVSADGNTSGEDTLLESLDKVKTTGGTVTLLDYAGVDNDDGIGVNITDAFTAPVTLVLDGYTLKGMVNAGGNTGLFTIDGSEIDSGIQCTLEAAIVSDGINLKLKGGTYASSAQPSRPAIMMMVEKNEPGEVEKLKTLLADGYAFADESDFAVTEEGRQPVAVTGKTVRVVKSAPVAVTGVSLNKTALSLEAGKNETLTATVAPENATNKAVTWKSSAADVASVDASGKVTALKPGAATITVTTTDGSKTATCAVTVTAVAAKPAPGGKLDGDLTQDKVDGVFGPGNATLDNTSNPTKITIDNSITPENPIEIETDVTIDLGGNTITGKPGQPGLVVGDDDKVTVSGGGTISGGDNAGGAGGNGITGGAGSDITIGGGVTVEGGDGTTGGDGIQSGGNVTVDGSVSGGNGSNGNGGDGVDTSGGSGDITLKPGGGVSGGDSTGGNGNGGNGTNSGGGTIIGGDVTGGNGNGSGSGGNGTTTGSGDTTISGGGSATGGSGGNASSGTGGNGGNGSASTGNGSIEVGGGSTGGNGGSGATGGTGGNGTSTGGSTTVTGGGTATGGTGGSGSANGGNGGNGTDGDNTTINGGTTGGNGGNGTGNGNGGNGGNGANQDTGTVGGGGTATGGDGGNGAGTGNGGSGGAGVGGGAGAGSVTTKPGANGRKATSEVDDSKSGTTVTVPDESKLADAALTEDEKKDPAITEVKVVLNVEKKNNQPDKAEIEKVLSSEAANTIGAFFDITLDKIITNAGGVQPPTGVANTREEVEITITIPSDMRGGSNYVVIRVHNGTGAALTTTQSGNDLTFSTDKFSTYAIAYTPAGTDPDPGPGPNPNPGPSGGGSGSSSSDDGYDFWMSVKEKIQNADSGDVIKVNAKGYDKMPWSVMDALRKNSGVSLVITWSGKTITIPAGKAQKNESGRIYWPLSKLVELYADIAEDTVLKPIEGTNPETGGPGKYIPVTGGGELITLEAPSPTIENTLPNGTENTLPNSTENTQTIAPTQPKAITPPDAGFEQDAFAGTEDAKQANSGNTFAVIALMLAAVAVGSGVWFWKKRWEVQ